MVRPAFSTQEALPVALHAPEPCKATRAIAPLVSVIVVVFRDRQELSELIENLAPFRGPELEVVVIDGGSDDGSADLLHTNRHRVDYWISELDRGIYDAMNKGLKAARGRWVLHINAGDRLLSVPYDRLRELDSAAEIFACRVKHPDSGFTFVSRMNWTFRFETTLHHQGTFYRREAHCGYDPTYKLQGDIAATQKMVLQGCRVALSTEVVSLHRDGGVSSAPGGEREWPRLIRENYGLLNRVFFTMLFMPARRMYRSLRKKIG